MNFEFSYKIIKELLEWGVREFYICAGARNVPLIEVLLNINGIKVYSHFDERSLAFYALGRIKALEQPVAVIVTSGTAVAELFPAIMEAYYSDLPLVAVTADRPKRQRGSGAPQTADQKDIYGKYVTACIDIEATDEIDLSYYKKDKPIHINPCFDLPLQCNKICNIDVSNFKKEQPFKQLKYNNEHIEIFKKFCFNSKNMLVIVSKNQLKHNYLIIKFLQLFKRPVYIESTSNIRECEELNDLKIMFAENLWRDSELLNCQFDSVLKIGNTPTHKLWRDIAEEKINLKVLSISESHFAGAVNAKHIQINYELFFSFLIDLFSKNIGGQETSAQNLLFKCKNSLEQVNKLFTTLELSEQSYFNTLSKKIPKNSKIYIGNSLPIRTWDFAASYENKFFQIEASRGLNGIDGQISTFLGSAETDKLNIGIFGDLTSLYDLQSLWLTEYRKNLSFIIIIINNSGGQIFNGVLNGDSADFCKNIHSISFFHWAKMWGIDYFLVENKNDLEKLNFETKKNLRQVIEIKPCSFQTSKFNNIIKTL